MIVFECALFSDTISCTKTKIFHVLFAIIALSLIILFVWTYKLFVEAGLCNWNISKVN